MENTIKLLSVFVLSFFVFGCASINWKKEEAVTFQKNLNAEYTNPKLTPLKEEEFTNFKGLEFFPISREFVTEATFEKYNQWQEVSFPTSANKEKKYIIYGLLHFTLKGQKFQLYIYQPNPVLIDYPTYLLLPFKDKTTGVSSYGAGRYIDIDLSDLEKEPIVLDFNKAYNPYCSYSVHYNCPIAPAVNTLDIAIEAGVAYTPHYK